MKIYKADYILGRENDYNQNEFILNLSKEFEFYPDYPIITDYSELETLGFLDEVYSLESEFKECIKLEFMDYYIYGIRIQEFEINENQAKHLIVNHTLREVSPNNTWIYYRDKKSNKMKEFKLMAFI